MKIFLIMLFSITALPEGDTVTPDTQGAITFEWPAELGGLEACNKFRTGASFWHPDGALHALGNCVELEAAPAPTK